MKHIITIFLLICSVFLVVAQEIKPSFIDISIGATSGSLLAGDQKNIMTDSLKPSPDLFNILAANATIAVYPIKYLGIEVSTNQFGLITAKSQKARSELNCYNVAIYEMGITGRCFFKGNYSQRTSIQGAAGINYSILDYNNDFKKLIPAGYYLYDIKPQIGYFATLGAIIYSPIHIFLGTFIKYYIQNDKIDISNRIFDGQYLVLNVVLGTNF